MCNEAFPFSQFAVLTEVSLSQCPSLLGGFLVAAAVVHVVRPRDRHYSDGLRHYVWVGTA